ncbi:MAG: tRNA pseudouridine(38-40) synthase TruA [Candidatus Dadabacteria bacterium]|nr:MAG: tRNA pseudouridine(38-40) synthase TruA [Candidatus Dadabacteria bacterium]
MRVKATIEYDGTHYAGWQRQPDQPTVQGEIERALAVALRRPTRVVAAGRTDAGVHALGQVAAFDVDDTVDLRRLLASVNALTPGDIAVVSLEPAAEDFDPRRHARSRTYEYTIVSGRPPSPLLRDRSWYVGRRLDPDRLERMAAAVCGEHDFRAFRASNCDSPSTVRYVFESRWTIEDGIYRYRITANAFLKQMVRILVGTMVDVCLGHVEERVFFSLLEGGDRRHAGRTAPARGLILLAIDYGESESSRGA